ncbi:hypothetical protein ACFZCP_01485 [Streptomyces sp. NPDC007971]|uniref:hypothetical protein n=1 Tax=Streptomyces sp. NPDC007971 TaxID=3364799 RepID=UPI0036E1FE0C
MAQQAAKIEKLHGIDALREGHDYTVLEVFVPHDKCALFRMEFIKGDDPALFDSRAFEVTSSFIPPSWRYLQLKNGSFSLCPEPWGQPGFWEAFYDRAPEARGVYESEKREILTSEQSG